ncbi:DNA polymerase domain-containing protein [Actinoplanes sp. DH11]|uniref:DNA polymerase domain-containing protein n=1 Tax=Actinoplanes sp. DH11 TaxID=2857011 RepID=UPI001E580299|nr:ATP-dependent DNA ligase [Actinoplanes sp. DH11]
MAASKDPAGAASRSSAGAASRSSGGAKGPAGEERDGVKLTNLDQELFPGAGATKRDLVDYLDTMADRLVPVLRDRPLSVIRVLPKKPGGEDQRFMQKNLPKYTPDWVPRTSIWADASHREVTYAMGNDRRTLLWFGNQRAIEYHPGLTLAGSHHPTHLIMDLDPPEDAGDEKAGFRLAVGAARLVRQVLADAGMTGAVKTSGSKGVHVFVTLAPDTAPDDVAAAQRAVAARAERLDPALATTAFIREDRHGKVFLDATRAGGATVAAAYSPRIRPGVPVSFPVAWADLDAVSPGDFTVHTAPGLLAGRDAWAEALPAPQPLEKSLIEEGHTIPVARVQAMHEGKRRAKARREATP